MVGVGGGWEGQGGQCRDSPPQVDDSSGDSCWRVEGRQKLLPELQHFVLEHLAKTNQQTNQPLRLISHSAREHFIKLKTYIYIYIYQHKERNIESAVNQTPTINYCN